MEKLNKALAIVSRTEMFPLHVSHRVNAATSSYGAGTVCTGQGNCRRGGSVDCRPRWPCDVYVPTQILLRDGTHDVPYAVDVEISTRLSAVRWTVAGGLNEQLARRARQNGEFRFGPDDRPCELQNRVSDLRVSELTNSDDKECVLKLII